MMSLEQRGSFYAILSGFLYGFIGYFGLNAINGNLSVSTMLFWRFFLSSVVIFIILLPRIKKINGSFKEMANAFFNGAFFYGFSTLLYFLSSRYIGSGLAMVLFFTYPVFIMIFNYFLYGQTIPKIYYLATLIILLGMLFLIDMNEIAFDLTGIFLAIVSALFYSGYIISSKRNNIAPTISTLMVSLGCMVTNLFIAFGTHSFTIPLTLNVWSNLLGISIIATVAPILLLLQSLRFISSEKASILSVLEPVFVVVFGVLLLGEVLQPWHAVGIVLILTGALLTLFSHRINVNQFRASLKRNKAV